MVVLLGLLGVALVHLLDLPGTITGSPVQGALYLLLIAGCLATDCLLLHATSRVRWILAAGLGSSTAIAYVLSRSVGLPFDHSDIGNWGDPLGISSLFLEGIVVAAACYGMWLGRAITALQPSRA
jgi:hypothetical protein